MIFLLVLNILSIFICYFIAKKRKADKTFWVCLGAFLGPLAIPFVFFSKPVDKNSEP